MPEIIKSVNLDANTSAFFARELEHIKARSYDIVYPEFKALSLIPVSPDAGAGAEVITYEQFDSVGIMKIISNYANDLPRSDIKGKQFSSPVRSLGGSYGYNLQEIRAAQMAGKPLVQRKANAVRRANDQEVNRIAWLAQGAAADGGLYGLFYNPNVTSGGAATGTWSGATATQIYGDMLKGYADIITLTKGVEIPDTLLLPIAQYQRAASLQMAAGTDTTVLEFFLKNHPSITKVEWLNECAGLNPKPSGAASATDIMVFYSRNPDKLTLEIPQMFEQLPVQERGLEYIVNAHSRIGGVVVYYPLSVNIVEGI